MALQLQCASLKAVNQARTKNLFSKTSEILNQINDTNDSKAINEGYELILDLIRNELCDAQKTLALLSQLKHQASQKSLKKNPYSCVFAGYILYQGLFIDKLSRKEILETFKYLNTLVLKSAILLKKKQIYLDITAIRSKHVELFKFLLYQKIGFRLDSGVDDLVIMASKENEPKLLNLCIQMGFNLNAYENMTPLMHAASRGHVSILKILMDYGAKITAEDIMGRTALFYAIEWGKTEAVKWLLSQNARIDSAAYLSACYHGNDDILDMVINKLGNVNIVDFGGNTPLMILAKVGNLKMIKRMIKMGANINAENCNGKTALFNAVICDHLEVVTLLLLKKADIKPLNNHKTEILKIHKDSTSKMLEILRLNGLDC